MTLQTVNIPQGDPLGAFGVMKRYINETVERCHEKRLRRQRRPQGSGMQPGNPIYVREPIGLSDEGAALTGTPDEDRAVAAIQRKGRG